MRFADLAWSALQLAMPIGIQIYNYSASSANVELREDNLPELREDGFYELRDGPA